MKPWPKVSSGELLALNRNAEGVQEHSRGLRSAATIPPDVRPHFSCTLAGCENGAGDLRRTILAPRQGADGVLPMVRGYRCAQPPANLWHPFRTLTVTFAWEGAIAIVSAAEDGMYGSTRYPTFQVDQSRCVPHFLLNYFKIEEGIQQLVKICPGSAGRNRVLSIRRISEVLVPLPPNWTLSCPPFWIGHSEENCERACFRAETPSC